MVAAHTEKSGRSLRQTIGLFLGPILAIWLQLIDPPANLISALGSEENAHNAWVVLSLLILMAVWWVSEALPIPVTALLPLVVLPLAGVQSVKTTSAEYFHPIVVLLMGGFIIAKAIERWNLHRRIALSVVSGVGPRPAMLVAGFMAAAALLSMWISNTATAIMLTPIALSVSAATLGPDDQDSPLPIVLLLGVAYACSIGGLGTLVGTPTNLIVVGYLNDTAGIDISFAQWMKIGVPTVLLLVPIAWFVLTRWAFKLPRRSGNQGQAYIKEQLAGLGKMSAPEIRTLMIFVIVAGLWIFKAPLKNLAFGEMMPFANLTDHVTAIIGVLLCFLIPSGSATEKGSMILDWRTAESIPWGVVLLFGGGMSLAFAIRQSGLGDWIGGEMTGLANLPMLLLIILLTTFVIFMTEVTSNVATASALMPVLGAIALSTGIDVGLMAIPLALAASCAFMLPMATGPNAVVYASGRVDIATMAAAGVRLNLVAIVVITILSYFVVPLVFG